MMNKTSKGLKIKKWHIVLIIILIFVIIAGIFFVKKVLFYKKAIEQGSIILDQNIGAYSSYGGIIKTKQVSVTRAEIESSDDPWMGSKKPIMTIVEFADFNCPYCLSAHQILRPFIIDNEDEVRLIYRDFPISEDIGAALASNCANEQGKFWEMHDKLFENQRILNEKAFFKFANEIKLDINKFQECYNSKKYESEIYADVALALKAGVSATPTFFVNGVKFQGVIPLDMWNQILQAAKNEIANQ